MSKIKPQTLLIAVTLGCLSPMGAVAVAGGVTDARINYVLTTTGSRAFFTLDKAITGTPACNTSQRFVVDVSTSGGAAQYSLLMQALATRALVSVYGSGNCLLNGDTEGVEWVLIKPT
jgi:hypothetical protein